MSIKDSSGFPSMLDATCSNASNSTIIQESVFPLVFVHTHNEQVVTANSLSTNI